MKSNYVPKLDLNLTNRCNLRCTHCAFRSGEEIINEMSLDKVKEIIKCAKDLGGWKVDNTGGECLLREEIYDIIKYEKDLGFKIELISNGVGTNEMVLNKLKNIGLDSIAFSLDGSNYEIHSNIRKVVNSKGDIAPLSKDIYNNIIQSIDYALKIGFPVKINSVVFESNLDDIPKITKWCIEKGIAEHGIYYFTPVGRGTDSKEKAVEPIKWLQFIREKLKPFAYNKTKLSLEFPLIEKKFWTKEMECIASDDRTHLQILPDGQVYNCAISASYHHSIANLNDISLKELVLDTKLWDNYWEQVLQRIHSYGGSCVNFKEMFKINDYDQTKYKSVCPLRKFLIEDVPE